MIKLRIRYPPLNQILEIQKDENFKTLRNRISELLNLDAESFKILSGFPPREVLCTDSDRLEDFFSDGNSVIIHHEKFSGIQAVSHKIFKSKAINLQTVSSPASFKKKECSSDNGKPLINTIYSTPKKKIRAKRKRKEAETEINSFEGQEAWTEELMHIFSTKNCDLTCAEKFLKGAFRNVVKKRYRSTLAEKRWTSVCCLTYEISNLQNYKFAASFPVSTRSRVSEVYVALPVVLLSAVLREVYSCENEIAKHNLRPYYMAEAHPTIFWNIVRHYSGNFYEGLKSLCPEIDWSFAFERKRDLSEKALENVRQKKEKEERKCAAAKKKKLSNKELEKQTKELKEYEADKKDEESERVEEKPQKEKHEAAEETQKEKQENAKIILNGKENS